MMAYFTTKGLKEDQVHKMAHAQSTSNQFEERSEHCTSPNIVPPTSSTNETVNPYSNLAKSVIIGGIYQHYKGTKHLVLNIARHSETLEEEVVYTHGNDIWVRPVTMFQEIITIDGIDKPRFKLCNV